LPDRDVQPAGNGRTDEGAVRGCLDFVHGFAKNEKTNLSRKELEAFKALAKILLGLSAAEINTAIQNGDFVEVRHYGEKRPGRADIKFTLFHLAIPAPFRYKQNRENRPAFLPTLFRTCQGV
jgi:hypothetical protein